MEYASVVWEVRRGMGNLYVIIDLAIMFFSSFS